MDTCICAFMSSCIDTLYVFVCMAFSKPTHISLLADLSQYIAMNKPVGTCIYIYDHTRVYHDRRVYKDRRENDNFAW